MWTETLDNPEAIKSVFDVPPSLEGVEIVSIVMGRDGPTVVLAISLNEPPSRPSPKWQRMRANAVSLKLQLFAVKSFSLEGWATDTKANLQVEGTKGKSVTVSAVGPNISLRCSCRFLSVQGISAYCRESPPVPALE